MAAGSPFKISAYYYYCELCQERVLEGVGVRGDLE
jgi:hypothetical protein